MHRVSVTRSKYVCVYVSCRKLHRWALSGEIESASMKKKLDIRATKLKIETVSIYMQICNSTIGKFSNVCYIVCDRWKWWISFKAKKLREIFLFVSEKKIAELNKVCRFFCFRVILCELCYVSHWYIDTMNTKDIEYLYWPQMIRAQSCTNT